MKVATAISLINTMNCSGIQETEPPTSCEMLADQYSKNLTVAHTMLNQASMHIEMARIGVSESLREAQQLKPKVHAIMKAIAREGNQLEKECPTQFHEMSGKDGLSNVARFDLIKTSIRKLVIQLGGYMREPL